MTNHLQAVADRIEAALEYLGNETDLVVAITLAEKQLRQARESLALARGPIPARRADDSAGGITFLRAVAVTPNPWPLAEHGPMLDARNRLIGGI